jgi:hypothetical protein
VDEMVSWVVWGRTGRRKAGWKVNSCSKVGEKKFETRKSAASVPIRSERKKLYLEGY